jgi:hypothetical protein
LKYASLEKEQVSEADLDRSTGPYFLLSDLTLGCQRAEAGPVREVF